MRKLVLATAVVGGSALAALTMGSGAAGVGNADPSDGSLLNVVGEPYAKAVAILRAQGVPTSFGGSVGSDVPQAQCVVASQKVTSSRKMQLMLDCTAAAQPQAPSGPSVSSGTSSTQATQGGRPTPGAPGVVTVIPTRVG